MNRIPDTHRSAVVEIINQTKSSLSQKRALLLRKGLLRSTTDELEILSEIGEPCESRSIQFICLIEQMRTLGT